MFLSWWPMAFSSPANWQILSECERYVHHSIESCTSSVDFSLDLETAIGKCTKLNFIVVSISWSLLFLGAITAIRDPITKEILCALVDDHLRQNHHHEWPNAIKTYIRDTSDRNFSFTFSLALHRLSNLFCRQYENATLKWSKYVNTRSIA